MRICLIRGNITDNIEYINCLVNSKDIRAISVILKELERVTQLKKNEFTDEIIIYYHFLRRRLCCVLIDMEELDDAETVLIKMLNEEINKEFALNELEYIKQLKSIRS